MAEHKLFWLFLEQECRRANVIYPQSIHCSRRECAQHAQSAKANGSFADNGRKARNRAMSTGFYWLINTPVFPTITVCSLCYLPCKQMKGSAFTMRICKVTLLASI